MPGLSADEPGRKKNMSADPIAMNETSNSAAPDAQSQTERRYPGYEGRETSKLGTQGTVEVWDLAQLTPNPLNPRGEVADDPALLELADSIRAKGVIEPLIITPAGRIIAGHRRRRACELAGVSRIRVIVQNLSEKDQLEMMLIENLQREPLDPLQEARAYRDLIALGDRVADIVRSTGVRREKIDAHLNLLKLPDKVQQWIAKGRLPFSAIRLLLDLGDEEQCLLWAEKAVGAGWSKVQLEKALGSTGQRPAAKLGPSSHTGPVVTRLMALESLRRQKAWPLRLETFELALNKVSCSCSVEAKAEKHWELCKNCPLAHFLAAFTREVYDATN